MIRSLRGTVAAGAAPGVRQNRVKVLIKVLREGRAQVKTVAALAYPTGHGPGVLHGIPPMPAIRDVIAGDVWTLLRPTSTA